MINTIISENSNIPRIKEFDSAKGNWEAKPKDIHSLWLLLRFTDNINYKTASTIGKELFTCAEGNNILNLATFGELLGFFERQDKYSWVRTEDGTAFANLSHWRLWNPNANAVNLLGYKATSTFFIKSEKIENRPLVIDLFAGVGGLSLGFEAAGFNVKVAVDNDRQACEAHKKNFPDCIVIEGDITEIAERPVELLCTVNGIDPRRVSGVIGGPPCQGFSYMGERASTDERNLLTSRFMDIVMGIEPDFFVMENVAGLLTSGALPKFGTHVRRLGKSIGEPATHIVERLPQAKVAVAKRDRQFRKRTISQAITSYKVYLLERFGETITLNSGATILLDIFLMLPEILIEKVTDAYGAGQEIMDGHEAIRNAIKSVNEDLARLTLGLFVDILMDKKLLSENTAENYLKNLVKAPSLPKIISRTFMEIAEEYDAAPKSEVYKGITVGPIIAHLIQRASEKYDVSAPMLLNAAWYGTPQGRQRLFLVGIHKRVNKSFNFPERKFTLPGVNSKSPEISATLFNANDFTLPEAPTVFEAIGDLPDIDNFDELREGDKIPAAHLSNSPSEYAARMRLENLEPNDFVLPRLSWNPFIIDCSNRTIHTKDVIDRLKQTSEGVQEETSHKTRLNRMKVSHTLRAGTREGKGSHTAIRPIHYEYHRVISVREGARIMGYPDWMIFHHTKWHGFRLVGNGVPYQLGNAVAEQIIKLLGDGLGE
jgi:DNA (cytosine-5)-methyltransferase 1